MDTVVNASHGAFAVGRIDHVTVYTEARAAARLNADHPAKRVAVIAGVASLLMLAAGAWLLSDRRPRGSAPSASASTGAKAASPLGSPHGPSPSTSGLDALYRLSPGCFNYDSSTKPSDAHVNEVPVFTLVFRTSCDEPHEAQIYTTLRLDNNLSPSGEYDECLKNLAPSFQAFGADVFAEINNVLPPYDVQCIADLGQKVSQPLPS